MFKTLRFLKQLAYRIFFIASMLLFSCSKKSTSGNVILQPANLTVTADVSANGSGRVQFTAVASNATSYEFAFGDGVYQIVPSGVVTYDYTSSGNYSVSVTAKNIAGQIIKSIDVNVVKIPQLIWSDEFNTTGTVDGAKWGFDIGTGVGGWGNNELQYYTNRSSNAFVADGLLHINAIKESFGGSGYTSAKLLTKDKFSFKYGKVEVRAKLPEGIGTWPAIWMLGNNIGSVGWPACGEIDIMEHKGSDPNRIFSTVHYPGHFGGGGLGSTLIINDASTSFHVYSTEWSASSINFFVDSQLIYSFPNQSTLPFNQHFYIIMNVAMGGTFGGSVDPAFTNSSMEVDYVRVYN